MYLLFLLRSSFLKLIVTKHVIYGKMSEVNKLILTDGSDHCLVEVSKHKLIHKNIKSTYR